MATEREDEQFEIPDEEEKENLAPKIRTSKQPIFLFLFSFKQHYKKRAIVGRPSKNNPIC